MYLNKTKILLNIFFIAMLFITLLVSSHFLLKVKINISENDYYNKQLETILTNVEYDNVILESKKEISDPIFLKYLGNIPQYIYTAFLNNKTQAIIISTTAPDGYNGNIHMLVAIKLHNSNTNHKILNVKILQHNETPGLGDLIEPTKSSWLQQFINRDSQDTKTWNDYDSITGATITSNAVTKAIYNCLLLVKNHPETYDNKQY